LPLSPVVSSRTFSSSSPLAHAAADADIASTTSIAVRTLRMVFLLPIPGH
jgi:hypothetical protein